jgi:hypothetical protein
MVMEIYLRGNSYNFERYLFFTIHVYHWLIAWLFIVLRLAQDFVFAYMETSPLPVKDCKIWAYARRSKPLSREGSLSCHTCCDTGPQFFWSHSKVSFSRLLRHTQGCGESILIRILMGITTCIYIRYYKKSKSSFPYWHKYWILLY